MWQYVRSANANLEGVLAKLVKCTTRGVQVEVLLRDGHKIRGFRVHEVIAPKGALSIPVEARARGIVLNEHGTTRDEYVQVRDIESVYAEHAPLYLASEDFFERHPLPLNWLRLARCPPGPRG